MGKGGFQACVTGTQVNLFMRSQLSEVEIHRLSSTATSRTSNSQPIPFLTGLQQPGTNKIDLNWQWSGSMNGVTFVVSQENTTNDAQSQIYSGSNLNHSTEMMASVGEQLCYSITAQIGSITSPQSNQVCFTQQAIP